MTKFAGMKASDLRIGNYGSLRTGKSILMPAWQHEAEQYKIILNSQKALLQSMCGLSVAQVDELTDLCYKKATTTIYPNSTMTLSYLFEAYESLFNRKMTYQQIIEKLSA